MELTRDQFKKLNNDKYYHDILLNDTILINQYNNQIRLDIIKVINSIDILSEYEYQRIDKDRLMRNYNNFNNIINDIKLIKSLIAKCAMNDIIADEWNSEIRNAEVFDFVKKYAFEVNDVINNIKTLNNEIRTISDIVNHGTIYTLEKHITSEINRFCESMDYIVNWINDYCIDIFNY